MLTARFSHIAAASQKQPVIAGISEYASLLMHLLTFAIIPVVLTAKRAQKVN